MLYDDRIKPRLVKFKSVIVVLTWDKSDEGEVV